MPQKAKEKTSKAATWWINKVFDISESKNTNRFYFFHDRLSCGDQHGNTNSCGILTYNAICHDIFGDELWTLKKCDIHCINAFVLLAKAHIDSYDHMKENTSMEILESTIEMHDVTHTEDTCSENLNLTTGPESTNKHK